MNASRGSPHCCPPISATLITPRSVSDDMHAWVSSMDLFHSLESMWAGAGESAGSTVSIQASRQSSFGTPSAIRNSTSFGYSS